MFLERKIKLERVFLVVMILGIVAFSVGAVSAASAQSADAVKYPAPNTYQINDASYSNYFDSNGNILSSSGIKIGDILTVSRLTNRDMRIDRPYITINSTSFSSFNNPNGIYNGTIFIDSPNCNVVNLTFVNVNKTAIAINNVSGTNVYNNNIKLTGNNADPSNPNNDYYTVTAISLNEATSYTTINNNKIKVDGNAPYSYAISNNIWGIDPGTGNYTVIINENITNVLITNNTISVITSGVYSAGIYTSTMSNYTISNNAINVSSNQFVYGVVVNDESSSGVNLATVQNVAIIDNNVTGYANITFTSGTGTMVYLIEMFLTGNAVIKNNILVGRGNGVYAVALYGPNNVSVNGNTVDIIAGDPSLVGTNYDYIGSGVAGIYLLGSASNLNIVNNNIMVGGSTPYSYGISNNIWAADPDTGEYEIIINQILNNIVISGNTIDVSTSGVYAAGIYTSTISNYTISNNIIDVSSNQFIYGIVVNDESSTPISWGGNANLIASGPVKNVSIINNKVTGIGAIRTINGTGTMVYLIELYLTGNTVINNNTLFGRGNGVYGAALYGSNYTNITNNDVTIYNGSSSYIGYNPDAILSGSAGVILYGSSTPSPFGTKNNYINITYNVFRSVNNATVAINTIFAGVSVVTTPNTILPI